MAWVALGKSLPEFVYFAVEICHCGPLPSATPGFSLGQKLCELAKHQRCRSAWVGQADFRKKGGKFLKKLWCCVGGSITR